MSKTANHLLKETILGFMKLFIGMGLLLFLPAGTFDFPEAWVFLAVFFAVAAYITYHLWHHDKKLLERRLKAGPGAEKERSQKIIMFFLFLSFAGLGIVPALDFRFGWSDVPTAVTILGNFLVVLGYLIIFQVFKESTYTAATIEIADNQKVVSSGPYAFVRHPMYTGGLIMLFGIPLALGSYWGLVFFLPILAFIVWRLLEEEKFLTKHLSGYSSYQKKTTYRLVPHVW